MVWVRRIGSISRVTPAAVLFEDWMSRKDVFLPISQIRRWGRENESFPGKVLCDLADADEMIWIEIPRWLAEKEFLK